MLRSLSNESSFLLLLCPLSLEEDVMIDAVLPKKLTSFHAAQGVHRSGVSSTVVLELNEEPPAPESNLLNVAPVDSERHIRGCGRRVLGWIIHTLVTYTWQERCMHRGSVLLLIQCIIRQGFKCT